MVIASSEGCLGLLDAGTGALVGSGGLLRPKTCSTPLALEVLDERAHPVGADRNLHQQSHGNESEPTAGAPLRSSSWRGDCATQNAATDMHAGVTEVAPPLIEVEGRHKPPLLSKILFNACSLPCLHIQGRPSSTSSLVGCGQFRRAAWRGMIMFLTHHLTAVRIAPLLKPHICSAPSTTTLQPSAAPRQAAASLSAA